MNGLPQVSWSFAAQSTASDFNDYSYALKTRQKIFDIFFQSVDAANMNFTYYSFANSIYFDSAVVSVNLVNQAII
jgi:hypothetical protein